MIEEITTETTVDLVRGSLTFFSILKADIQVINQPSTNATEPKLVRESIILNPIRGPMAAATKQKMVAPSGIFLLPFFAKIR